MKNKWFGLCLVSLLAFVWLNWLSALQVYADTIDLTGACPARDGYEAAFVAAINTANTNGVLIPSSWLKGVFMVFMRSQIGNMAPRPWSLVAPLPFKGRERFLPKDKK